MAALRAELTKLYRQRIAYAGFAVILVLVALLTWGSHHQREHIDVGREFGSQFVVAGKTVTALFVAHVALNVAMVVLVPLLIAVVVGALVAGERQMGTLRTLLSRPVPRPEVLGAKTAAAFSYAIALTLFLGASSLGLGQIVFGWGDLVVFEGGLTILEPHTGLIRLAQGYALACAATCTVAALGLMGSCIVDNPMTAAGLTVATLLVSAAVGAMPYFESVKAYLLTTHLRVYQEVFAAQIDGGSVSTSGMYLAGYTLAALVVAVIVFARRDVTC